MRARGRAGLAAGLIVLSGLCSAVPARADTLLQQVRGRGVVRCGSMERPGLAEVAADGHWVGLTVDVCRAIAAAIFGSADRIDYHEYESPADFDRVRKHVDDVSFLTGREMAVERLSDSVIPGPTVFIASDAVMVPGNAPETHVDDLAGSGICFMIADSSEHSLENHFDAAGKPWFRHPYSETGEMNDAYAVQRCHAIAAETTELAHVRLYREAAPLESRILPEPINVFPVVAATGTRDAQWAAIVAWTVHTLISAERPESKWLAGGARAMPIPAPGLGLKPDWQQRVLAAVGHYGSIFDRNLGAGSPYRLDRGLNRQQIDGGMLLSPFVE